MDKALKAAVYGRCRRDLTQTSGVGLYAHSAGIGLYARSLVKMVTQNPDWTCVGMYIDEDQDWKAYERLREDADKGLFDAVILRDLADFQGEYSSRISALPCRVYVADSPQENGDDEDHDAGKGYIRLLPQRSMLPSPKKQLLHPSLKQSCPSQPANG